MLNKKLKETWNLKERATELEPTIKPNDDSKNEIKSTENNENNETSVVVTRRIKDEYLHDSSSSSSLTEEQMQVVGSTFFDDQNESSDMKVMHLMENYSSSSEDSALNEQSSKNLTLKIDKNNIESKIKPIISPKPTPEKIQLRKQSLSLIGVENQSDMNQVRSLSQRPSTTKLLPFYKFNREVIHSEYGYICKIPIEKSKEENSEKMKNK